MVTSDTITEMMQGNLPAFVFKFGGMVQFWQEDYRTGIIIATSGPAADVVAADLSAKKGARISVSEIGTVLDETLAGHMTVSVLDHGATGVFVTDDGKTIHYFEAPPMPN